MRTRIANGERPGVPKGKAELAEMRVMLTKCWERKAEERITTPGVASFLHHTWVPFVLMRVPHADSMRGPISGTSHSLKTVIARSQYQPTQGFIDELDESVQLPPVEHSRFKDTQFQTKSEVFQQGAKPEAARQGTRSPDLPLSESVSPRVLIPGADGIDVGAPKRRKKLFCGLF